MRRMRVSGITVDPSGGSAVLILQDDGDVMLPISIGIAEATSIAKELEGLQLPRPLTHDLMRALLEHLSARLEKVEITDLRDNTYYAELVVRDSSGQEGRIDSRPSDGIALAVRVDAPIFVHEHVLRKALPEAQEIQTPTDKEEWKKLLEEMDPEDFGKYKM